jgi:hypothetical protein
MSMPPPPPPGDQPPFQPYGSPPPGYAPYGQPFTPGPAASSGNSGMAIAGFVLGLVSVVVPCFWFWFLQIPGVLGLIFSILGLKATKDGARKGRGLAIAGFVLAVLGILIAVALTAVVYTSDSCVHDGLNMSCNFD